MRVRAQYSLGKPGDKRVRRIFPDLWPVDDLGRGYLATEAVKEGVKTPGT
jgi:hypothetical protein